MSNRKNPVFALTLALESGVVRTHVRVHDLRSLDAVFALARANSFGRVSAKRFFLTLHSGEWEYGHVVPLALEKADGTLDHMPDSLRLLREYYRSIRILKGEIPSGPEAL